MASILPKFKMYAFVGFIMVIVNIGINLVGMVYSDSFNIILLLSGFATAFIPFVSILLPVVYVFELPIEVTALMGIVVGIVGVIQAYLIVEILLNHAPTVNI